MVIEVCSVVIKGSFIESFTESKEPIGCVDYVKSILCILLCYQRMNLRFFRVSSDPYLFLLFLFDLVRVNTGQRKPVFWHILCSYVVFYLLPCCTL